MIYKYRAQNTSRLLTECFMEISNTQPYKVTNKRPCTDTSLRKFSVQQTAIYKITYSEINNYGIP